MEGGGTLTIFLSIIGTLATLLFLNTVYFRWMTSRAAKRMRENLNRNYSAPPEYRNVDKSEFTGLDLEFYDRSQRFFEEEGYRFVGDLENVAFTRNNPDQRTFSRAMIDATGTSVVGIYHMKFNTKKGCIESKVVEVESEMTNGDFWISSNATIAGAFTSPPSIHAFFLLETEGPDQVLRNQHDVLSRALANSELQLREFETVHDIIEMQNRQHAIKCEFRQKIGLMTRAEYQAIAGQDPRKMMVADAIMDQFEKLSK